MKKMELIRAVIELTGLGIIRPYAAYPIVEKIVKCKKQSMKGVDYTDDTNDLIDVNKEEEDLNVQDQDKTESKV